MVRLHKNSRHGAGFAWAVAEPGRSRTGHEAEVQQRVKRLAAATGGVAILTVAMTPVLCIAETKERPFNRGLTRSGWRWLRHIR